MHGPDSDDESNIVRSKKEGEEEEGTDGKKGGKRAAQAEAAKQEAKMSRELVQIVSRPD